MTSIDDSEKPMQAEFAKIDTLRKKISFMRKLLREVVDFDLACADFANLQARIRSELAQLDDRSTRAGFAQPEVQQRLQA